MPKPKFELRAQQRQDGIGKPTEQLQGRLREQLEGHQARTGISGKAEQGFAVQGAECRRATRLNSNSFKVKYCAKFAQSRFNQIVASC